MKKLSGLLCFLLIGSLNLIAQSGKLTLHGVVENQSYGVDQTNIEIYQDNELLDALKTERNGSYKLELDLGSIYNVSFSKEGYVKKSVAVIAKSDSTIEGRYYFQLDIELFRVDQELLDESMLPPVAKLYIKDEEMGFRYDKKYVKWMSGEYENLEK